MNCHNNVPHHTASEICFLFFAFLFVTELFVKLCFVVSNDFFVNYYKI